MLTPLPSLNGLRAFEAAARHLSFTKAAAELHVTQTAISHQIRRLEEQLGQRLFVRDIRAVHLTPAAEDYLVAVHAAFDELRVATAQLRRHDAPSALHISLTPSLAMKWLMPRLAAFHALHPDIAVSVSTSMQLVDFRREQVDLAIRYGRGSWPGVHAIWLMSEDIFPVCSPALRDGLHALRRPADLAQHRLLSVTSFPDEWLLWLTAAGLPTALADHAISFDMQFLAFQAAIDGLGVAIGHSPLVQADLAAGRLVVPFSMALPSEMGFYLVTPDAAPAAPVRLLRDWLLTEAAGRSAAQRL